MNRLTRHGVGHVFGVSGANIEDFFDAVHRSTSIDAVLSKHEFGATTMADGYARTSNRLGVVASTSGGGAMNLVAGVAESFASKVPILAVIGQPPTVQEGLGAFQDTSGLAGSIDARALFAHISLYCAFVRSAADFPERLEEALAATARGGPAVLLLPKDIQVQPCDTSCGAVGSTAVSRSVHLPDVTALAETLYRSTGRVTVIVGDEVPRSDARSQVAALVSALGAYVAVTPDAKDAVDAHGRGFLGVAGVMGGPDVAAALQDSDVCLLIGTRLPMMASAGLSGVLANLEVHSIGSSPPYVPAEHVHTGNLRASLRMLTEVMLGNVMLSRGMRVPGESAHVRVPRELTVPDFDGPGIRYREAMVRIAAAAPPGTDVFADAGNTGAAAVHHLTVSGEGRFVVALGMGGMGYAFGAGIGSALSRGRRTFVVAGDGAFFMHGMEIHTAVEYDVPVTFVLLNNNAHAMCVTREKVFGYEDQLTGASINMFRPADLVRGLTSMFPDLPGHTARTGAELDAALSRSSSESGPSVIEIVCNADEYPPFAPLLTPRENHDVQPQRTH